MKNILITISVFSILLSACSKSTIPPTSTVAGLNVFNATIGTTPLVVKNNNAYLIYSKITSSNEMAFGSYFLLSPTGGSNNYQFIQSTDTLHTLFIGTFNLQTNNTYSLFLAGTVASPDTLLVHDNLPYHTPSDSTAGIRFVNLSPGSNPISVDIKGNTNGSEVASLSYKGITNFKNYVANHTISSYIFEFRDAGTGNLLTSYTLSGVNNSTGTNTTANTVRFKNLTLALIGQPAGGTVAQKVILINNY